MRNSRSFQGLYSLDPHQGSALDPLGAHTAPRPPAGISNDRWLSHIVPSARQPYPANNFTLARPILLYPAQKLDNPPNRQTSYQKPAKKSSTGGCVTQGCVRVLQGSPKSSMTSQFQGDFMLGRKKAEENEIRRRFLRDSYSIASW